MDSVGSLDTLLAGRTAQAEALLADAVRVDIAAFFSMQIEDRLRGRPNFLGRTPQVALHRMRVEMEAAIPALGDRARQPVEDLRVFLGAAPKSIAEEEQALANALSFVADAAREQLNLWCFPGDNRPDRAEDTGIDLDAEYRVAYKPQAALLWAWRKVRGLDTARNQLADAAGRELPQTLELKLYLPEALPLDKT